MNKTTFDALSTYDDKHFYIVNDNSSTGALFIYKGAGNGTPLQITSFQ